MKPSTFYKANKGATCILIGTTKFKSIYISRITNVGVHMFSENSQQFLSGWVQSPNGDDERQLAGQAELYLRSADAEIDMPIEVNNILHRLARIS